MGAPHDDEGRPLATLLAASLADPRRAEGIPPAELEHALAQAVAEARARWAPVRVDDATFVRWLAERVTDDADLLASVRRLHHVDLYLACACRAGDPGAIAAFEKELFGEVDLAAARARIAGLRADDLRQVMHERLFIGTPEGGPKIESYSGRGALRGWMRVAAMRAALNLGRKTSEVPVEADRLMDLPGAVDDPELDYIKRTYRAAFKEAFAVSLGALSFRERNLVRYAIGQGLDAESIAPIYRVHATTVRRWLAAAKESLFQGVRREMMARLGVNRKECESILHLIRSRLELTLGGAGDGKG